MQCFPFYKPQQTNPIGRIPPNRLMYEGIAINPESILLYKNEVINSINANTYTQNQVYSYASTNQFRYICLQFK